MMALPPLEAGAFQASVTLEFPAVAVSPVGAPGTVAGVTALEAADAGPVPTALVAVTVNVYLSPLDRPVTVIGLAVPVATWPPRAELVASVAVTVYWVIAEPPLDDGALNDTFAEALPATAITLAGAPGTARPGVTALDAADAGPVPTELVAVTVNV